MKFRYVLLAALLKLSSFSNLKKLVLFCLSSTIVSCSQSQGTTEASSTTPKSISTPAQIAQVSNQSEELTTKETVRDTSISTNVTTESKSITKSNTSDISKSNGFIMPSKNIYCNLREPSPQSRSSSNNGFLRCEIVSGLNPMPPRPKNPSCEFDWGGGLVLLSNKKVQVLCASDSAYSPDYPILQYGQTWTKSGFTCKSATDGLTCTNAEGQGFFLNREEWQTF
ncbi:MAG: hypothetical protein DCF19_07290 [Pseudanabaena frigida]|uniref:Ig-like domain-containing protein n=1 Tax=Pseudanabaena frigida TaxID=945775 RepID=A0A2W4WBY2_9CYAN|nr:MAG: hypothetical protein DCF19_07290 [Pseudanabaena frigida]